MTVAGIRTALVTGGSKGIGAATARELGARGFRVAVNYFSDEAAADRVVAQIEEAGGSAFTVGGDVRDPDQAAELVRRACEGGVLEVMVCNAKAASFIPTPVHELSWSDFSSKIVNELAGVYFLTQRALSVMGERRNGRIIYVSSDIAQGPVAPGMTAHGTAKAALDTFARFVSTEAGPFGINVSVVAPGFVRTEASAGMSQELQRRLAERTPLGRVAEPQDVARAIAMLAGEDAGFVTGTVLTVNGGFGVARM